jgi:periplasmic copper chaperone A
MIRRFVLTAAVTSMALLAVGGAASAHIDPDPAQAQAGSRLTVGFTVEHGCDGSPTVRLDMRLPEGVTDPVPEPLDGWDGSVDTVDGDTIVTFAGGSLADDVEGTFSVTMTLPPVPGTTIYFPFVQRCDVDEIRWIGIPAEPGDELDEPAPAMELTGPVTEPTETAPVTTAPVTTAPATTAPATTAPATTDPATTATTGTSEPVVIAAAGDDTVDTGNTGTIAFIASMAAVLGLGGFVVFRSRQARAGTARDAT